MDHGAHVCVAVKTPLSDNWEDIFCIVQNMKKKHHLPCATITFLHDDNGALTNLMESGKKFWLVDDIRRGNVNAAIIHEWSKENTMVLNDPTENNTCESCFGDDDTLQPLHWSSFAGAEN